MEKRLSEQIAEMVESGELTKANFARARGQSTFHSTRALPIFLKNIDKLQQSLSNMGLDLIIKKKANDGG